MTKPPIESVATLSGRELDAAVHHFVAGKPIHQIGSKEWNDLEWVESSPRGYSIIPAYSTSEGESFFALIAAVRAKGWTFIDMQVGFYDTETVWTVCITCGRGPCELHGNPHDDAHSVEARADTLPLAFARASLLTTYLKESTHAR